MIAIVAAHGTSNIMWLYYTIHKWTKISMSNVEVYEFELKNHKCHGKTRQNASPRMKFISGELTRNYTFLAHRMPGIVVTATPKAPCERTTDFWSHTHTPTFGVRRGQEKKLKDNILRKFRNKIFRLSYFVCLCLAVVFSSYVQLRSPYYFLMK